MLAIGAPLRKWTLHLLLCSISTCGFAHSTNETAIVQSSTATPYGTSTQSLTTVLSSPTPSTTSSPDTTCPFRTINHITHTLPQQCLRTGWSAPGQDASAGEVSDGAARPTIEALVPAAKEQVADGAGATYEGTPSAKEPRPEQTGSADVASAPDSTSTHAEPELETDSPLDNANFLSFEEWKNKNLVRAGQSPENVGQARAASADQRNRRRPVNVNALDSLGEESEIEIDFSGFGNPSEDGSGPSSASPATHQTEEATPGTEGEDKAAPSAWALSKDAGKTCKERFNYASFDCAATVLKTNPKAKSTSAILVENKDSYMLNECSAQNKFIIVELCDDILVDTIVLANYEFFSSMFRHFRISVSDRYPVKMDRWRVLGTFEARNSRDIQPFLIKEPQIWARYLRLEFLTRYGNEFYCPMSLLRVHGTTMMEQFRREEEQARGDDDFVEPIEAADGDPIQTAVLPSGDADTATIAQDPIHTEKEATATPEPAPQTGNATSTSGHVGTSSHATEVTPQAVSSTQASPDPAKAPTSSSAEQGRKANSTGADAAGSPAVSKSAEANEPKGSKYAQSSIVGTAPAVRSADASSLPGRLTVEEKANSSASVSTSSKAARPPSNETAGASSGASSGKPATNSTSNGSSSQGQGRSPSQTQAVPPTPTTQESFFKSIHKRLQSLEANSTLSLQYIEEQSRILRDAFIKVEKKQLQKTEKFLEYMNNTVIQELKSYRNMYEQLWQSTILELEAMKERQKSEMGEIGTRLSMVAEELVWQKRMAVVQSTLLLLCLGLVLFVRSGTLGSQTDVPFTQQLGNTYNSFFDSPPPGAEITRGIRRRRTLRNIWKSDTSIALSDRSGQLSDSANIPSDEETDGRRSPVQIAYNPPTPITPGAPSEVGKVVGSFPEQYSRDLPERDTGLLTPTGESSEDQAKRIQVLETQSGPATPRGSRDDRPSWEEVDRAVELLKAEEAGQNPQLQKETVVPRRKRRSPLRRAESYDGVAGNSPDDEGSVGLFTAG